MEQVFEGYVYHWLKQQYPGWTLSAQDQQHHLVEDYHGRQAFGLRPDFVLTSPEGRFVVADAKWKRLDPRPSGQLSLSQADLYQLYAYGKKYQVGRDAPPELWLLYPEQPGLKAPVTLGYESAMKLTLSGVALSG
jgi:5-methylcytosine-specific restriction enzyme subunit McrC